MVNTRANLSESHQVGEHEDNDNIIIDNTAILPPADISEPTRVFLEKHFKEVVQKLSDNAKTIADLTGRLGEAEKQINELQVDKTHLQIKVEQLSDQFSVKVDDLEQYQRRQNIRIENIKSKPGETEEQLFEDIKSALGEVGVNIEPRDVIRFHRSAAPRRNKNGDMCAQVLLKLSHWSVRRTAHFANKKARENRLSVRIHHDLTRRRYTLLSKARRLLDQHLPNERSTFCYADMNSNLLVRRGENTHPFNTESELDTLITRLSNE